MATNLQKRNLGNLDYTVKTYQQFGNIKRYTGEPFTVFDFGMIENLDGKKVHVEAVKLTRTTCTVYANGEDLGPFESTDNLMVEFNERIAYKLINSIKDALFEHVHNIENTKVYVSNPDLDDPNRKQIMDNAKAYWSINSGKFNKLIDDNLNTTTAFYKQEQIPGGLIKHTKFRISNTKTKTVNIDESYLIEDANGQCIKPEAYVKTISKIEHDAIAWWLNFKQFIGMDAFNNPTSEHFK
jgi:hypothetical protein